MGEKKVFDLIRIMATRGLLTEAHQHEMQEKLEHLTSCHKKAKLQKLFLRQDELRPFTSNNNVHSNSNLTQLPQSPMPTMEDIEAMKVQFNDLQKTQLQKQISKQFNLRNLCDQKQKSLGNASDTSGDIKVNEEDVSAMKQEFDKKSKLLLTTQIEKSFRLRTESENAYEDEYNLSLSEDDKNEDSDKRLIEEFQAMNKEIIRQRTSNHLTMTGEPKITSLHKVRFHGLMRDIGIVNDNILDSLWMNIEHTIHPKTKSQSTTNDIMSKLEAENKALKERLNAMQKELDLLRARDGKTEIDSDDDMEIIN